jgi:hypothetical protein
MNIPDALKAQIDAAFDYRGHVTVRLADGGSFEGFLYNRRYEEGWVELFVKNTEERRRVEISAIASVELTGEDAAAGKSYEDHLKKKAAKP